MPTFGLSEEGAAECLNFGFVRVPLNQERDHSADEVEADCGTRDRREMVAQTAVRAVIVLEGVNDLGTLTRDHDAPAEEHAALVSRIEAAYHGPPVGPGTPRAFS